MNTPEEELLMMTLISTTKRKTLGEFGFDKFVNLAANTFHEAKINAIRNRFDNIDVNVLKLPYLIKNFSFKNDVYVNEDEMPFVLEVIGYLLASKREDKISGLPLISTNAIQREKFVIQAAQAFYEAKDSDLVVADIRNAESYLQDIALKNGYLIPVNELNDAAFDVRAEINLMQKGLVGFEEKRKFKLGLN